MPPASTLPAMPEQVRCSVVETDDIEKCRREILGGILALSEADLGSAMETLLRSLTVAAAHPLFSRFMRAALERRDRAGRAEGRKAPPTKPDVTEVN